MFEFKLPDLGEGIHEGEILKWHVAAGDTVQEDAPLVDVETDKAAVTIPSPRGGKIVSLTGAVGDIIHVGQVITVIDDGSGAEIAPTKKEAAEAPAPAVTSEAPSPAMAKGPLPAAPATRRLARELGVDINLAQPTGPGGRVTPEDVHRLAAGESVPVEAVKEEAVEAEFSAHAASAIPLLDIEPLPDFSRWGPVDKEPLRSIRRKVARKMVTSMVLVPHVAHMDDADVTLLEEFRKEEQKRREGTPGGRLSILPFVVKAITAGLRAAPAFNASLDPFKEEIVYKKYYNIGIAVDSGHGLIVPVVKETDRKSVMRISADIEDLAGRAREGKLEVSELRGGTFTITNVGPIGGTALIPTINYPEVAILGMGRVQEKPVVRDGQVVIRKILPLTLAFDHRVADGADAARFVTELARQLSDPKLLLLES
jgi:pyruvate dehydrogenase E2 component (dihydrolipoamide acetyltransferase)